NTQKVQGDVTAALAKVSLPPGASTSTGGVFAQLSSLLTQFAVAILAAIVLLMLIGIVVTNAIVLLDLVEQYRDRGLNLHDALIEGGRHRLRPILMTAFATMLALVPLAVSGNSGGAFI